MIQIFFGDDEHTAAEGPYVRMLKARKWLYLAAFGATLHSYNLVDLAALNKLLGGVFASSSNEKWLLTWGLGSGLAYLIIQYALICFQLATAYARIIEMRLPDGMEGQNIRSSMHSARRQLRRLEIKREVEMSLRRDTGELDDQIEKLQDAIQANFLDLADARVGDPTFTPEFRIPELLIDLLRIAPPLLIALSALVHLILAHPGF